MSKRRIDHDAVLNLWADGYTCSQIAKRVEAKPDWVSQIVCRERRKGDPRAVKRANGRPNTGYVRPSCNAEWYQNAPWTERDHLDEEMTREWYVDQDTAFQRVMRAHHPELVTP